MGGLPGFGHSSCEGAMFALKGADSTFIDGLCAEALRTKAVAVREIDQAIAISLPFTFCQERVPVPMRVMPSTYTDGKST